MCETFIPHVTTVQVQYFQLGQRGQVTKTNIGYVAIKERQTFQMDKLCNMFHPQIRQVGIGQIKGGQIRDNLIVCQVRHRPVPYDTRIQTKFFHVGQMCQLGHMRVAYTRIAKIETS